MHTVEVLPGILICYFVFFCMHEYESDFMKIIINQFLNDEVIIGAFYNYAACLILSDLIPLMVMIMMMI